MFAFKRNSVQVKREERYRRELSMMDSVYRKTLRQTLIDSNSEDMSNEFMVNPYTKDYLSHI